ncbi:hypothetical protein ZIOFF_010904 [Zingiber officinale]|uniref:Uncharacterized protein n=1 Tax=Zingiber officinale TaxID=94328 RepID=A0A8J5HPQ8_ZINOF|nr:hypothetical protein ZIOFF_010904 [Zingiber officinale]
MKDCRRFERYLAGSVSQYSAFPHCAVTASRFRRSRSASPGHYLQIRVPEVKSPICACRSCYRRRTWRCKVRNRVVATSRPLHAPLLPWQRRRPRSDFRPLRRATHPHPRQHHDVARAKPVRFLLSSSCSIIGQKIVSSGSFFMKKVEF